MPAPEFPSAAGLVFTFDGEDYTATQVSVSRSARDFDVTSVDLSTTSLKRYRVGAIENCEIKVDWIGATMPPVDEPKNFTFTGGTNMHAITHSSLKALCTGLSMQAQAGDLVRGSATFKLSYD